jgi:phosphoglycerate dehydrogenase-like enzyme
MQSGKTPMVISNGRRPVAVFNFSNPWMRHTILQAAPPQFDTWFIDDPTNSQELDQKLPEADFLVTIALPTDWIGRMRRCRLVQLQGVGHDAIPLPLLEASGIPLAATPEGTIQGVAEHTILLILALSKQLVQVHASVAQGEFDSLRWRPQCHSFAGQTLGIVGYGRIGRRVAQLAEAFGARAIYFDTDAAARDYESIADFVPFDQLLSESDVVSVHTPLNDSTWQLFGAQQFAQMKPGALFINTSRGATYNMDALAAALQSGHLRGAGLDVFEPQPPPAGHPLLQLPNVICTPHMATGTVEAHREKARSQFANFIRVLQHEAPHNLVSGDRWRTPLQTCPVGDSSHRNSEYSVS